MQYLTQPNIEKLNSSEESEEYITHLLRFRL